MSGMHPFVASQIAITFAHEAQQRTALLREDLTRHSPARRRLRRK
jgi:hypothetical protein